MTRRSTVVPGFVLALAGAVAAPAFADPSIGDIAWTPGPDGKVEVSLRASVGRPGKVRVEGTVNGLPLKAKKRVGRGTRDVRLRIDARQAGLRDLDEPLVFDLTASVAERRSPEKAVRSFAGTVPVPLVVLGGLGNEGDAGSTDAFAAAIDLAAGGAYGFGTETSSLTAHSYPSLTAPLAELGDGLEPVVADALRGTVFGKVDVVGFSMGGLVARQWAADHAGDRVRKMVLLATPNEGAPLAYVAYQLTTPGSTFSGLLDGLPVDPSTLVGTFLPEGATESLRSFFPTYSWAYATFDFFGVPVTGPIPSVFLPDSASPLTALNRVGPPAGADVHAVFCSALLPDVLPAELLPFSIGTVDTVDFTDLLAGGTPDLTQIASGDGDGVVPVRSARMDDVPAWKSAIVAHDLGAGFHATMTLDPRAVAEIAAILAGTR